MTDPTMESLLLSNAAVSASLMDQSIDEALAQWNEARAVFAKSLQAYLGAFSHFEVLCAQFFDSKVRDAARPDVRQALDQEIISLAPHDNSIAVTRVKLLQLKNMSKCASAIGELPTEILARIFILAVDSCRSLDAGSNRRDSSISLVNAISGVCSYWRRIAVSTRPLWSHIDFERLGHIDYCRLWVERAGNHPLDIVEAFHFDLSSCEEEPIPAFLLMLRHIGRVRSMLLKSDYLLEKWFSEWCNNGTPHMLTTLALHVSSNREEKGFPAQGETVNRQRLDELFHSLETFYVRRLPINWDLMGCRNLVTLSLLDLRITINALRQLLLANPKLQYIHLHKLELPYTSPSSTGFPLIRLDGLQTLRLEALNSHTIRQILSMIAPGNDGLALTITQPHDRIASKEFKNEFLDFCRRSHLKKLHCGSPAVLWDAIAVAPQLEVLVLNFVTLCSSVYNLILPPTNGRVSSVRPRLPHLHSIYAISCTFNDLEDFRRVVSGCSIREIGIIGGFFLNNNLLYDIREFRSWAGPGVNAVSVPEGQEMGYDPFGTHSIVSLM